MAPILCQRLFETRSLTLRLLGDGHESLLRTGPVVWAFVDPVVTAFPLAALVTWLASHLAPPLPREHLESCFGPSFW